MTEGRATVEHTVAELRRVIAETLAVPLPVPATPRAGPLVARHQHAAGSVQAAVAELLAQLADIEGRSAKADR